MNDHDHTVSLPQGEHEAIHQVGWINELMAKVTDAERQLCGARRLSPQEIISIGREHCREFQNPDTGWLPYKP